MDKKTYVLFLILPNEKGEEVGDGEHTVGEYNSIKAAHEAAVNDAQTKLDLWQVKNYFDQGEYFWTTRIGINPSEPFYEIHNKDLLR